MKKNLIITVCLIILIFSGCGNGTMDLPISELQVSQEDFKETYVEGIIPAGNYYFNGETSRGAHTFCIDEQGRGYSIRNHNGQNYVVETYTYDPDTGIYTFDTFVENFEGITHYIDEGYFNEEDCSIVITKWGYALDNTSVRTLSTLKYELIRR